MASSRAHQPSSASRVHAFHADLPTSGEGYERLLSAFQRGAIPPGHSHQATYLALMAWCVARSRPCEAVERVIGGLRAMERAGAPPLAPGKRYNETIALFWLVFARAHVAPVEGEDAQIASAQAFSRRFSRHPEIVYRYFRPSTVHSWRARARWVEPDVRPLDVLSAPPPAEPPETGQEIGDGLGGPQSGVRALPRGGGTPDR